MELPEFMPKTRKHIIFVWLNLIHLTIKNKGPELWIEYTIGYKWNFAPRFYLNIQPGLGHALWLQQDWPGVEKKPYGEFVKGSVIFVPQVLIGWAF
jgi:hypothetical protein